ncbi:MAG: hypothetical protein ACREAD_01395 [Nitrosopumilaceae archaeon]
MINPDILVATSNWFLERRTTIDSSTRGLLFSTMFYVLEALHKKVSTLSMLSISGISYRQIGSTNAISLGMFVSPDNYANFRSVLSLIGDLYHILEKIKEYELFELKSMIDDIYEKADSFRDLRNFFTHLDSALKNLEVNGVSGELKTNCGIEYEKTAKNCFHLIINNETIYFTWDKKALEKCGKICICFII